MRVIQNSIEIESFVNPIHRNRGEASSLRVGLRRGGVQAYAERRAVNGTVTKTLS